MKKDNKTKNPKKSLKFIKEKNKNSIKSNLPNNITYQSINNVLKFWYKKMNHKTNINTQNININNQNSMT